MRSSVSGVRYSSVGHSLGSSKALHLEPRGSSERSPHITSLHCPLLPCLRAAQMRGQASTPGVKLIPPAIN